MSFLRISSCMLGLLTAAAVTPPAFSSTITFTDQAAWQAASSGLTSIGFGGIASPGSTSGNAFSTSTGLTLSGVQFIGINGVGYALTVVDSAYVSPYWDFGSGATLETAQYNGTSPLPYIHVILPAGITAFGVDLMTVSPNGLGIQVVLSDGTTETVTTLTRPNRAFFGATSTAAISFVDFTVQGTTVSGGTFGLLDNFSFGTAGGVTPVPEACTALMIGTGLIVLRQLRRSGKRPAQTAIA